MYKKIILAASIASLAGGATAATWDTALTTAVTHHKEGIEGNAVADGFEVSNAMLTFGVELAVNDTITFTYNVNKATNANWPTSLYSRNVGTAAATIEANGAGAVGATRLTTQLVNDSNTASQAGIVNGDKFTIAGSATVHTITDIVAGGNNTVDFTPALTAISADEAVMTFSNQTASFVTFGLQSSTTNSATYRVLSIADGSTTVGAQVPTPAINMNVAEATAAGSVTVSYSAATSAGAAIDTATLAATTVATLAKQQTLSITKKLDGVVDVEADRKSLAGVTADVAGANTATANAAGASNDAIIVDYATVAAATGTAVSTTSAGVVALDAAVASVTSTLGSSVTTINGDFTWMDNAAAAGVTISAGAVTGNEVASDSMNATGTVLTVTDTALGADKVILLTADQAANVLPVTSWSGSTTVTYTPATGAAKTEVYTWADLGAWTLNGATVTAYGVPMGDAVSRFLWVNNAGASDAAMTYTIMMNGSSYGPYSIGTVAGKSAASVGGLIDTDLTARSIYVAPNSRANITLTSQVKAADITVSAAYKHIGDADRIAIETSDTIDGTAK